MVEQGTEPSTVLVPVDESPLSDEALEYAIKHHPGSDIIALHVIDLWEQSYAISERPGVLPDEYWESVDEYAHDQAEAILDAAKQLAEEHGVEIQTKTVTGEAARTLVEAAEDEDADAIVIGSHGRTGVSRILLGSVAETVVRRAPCAVTVVR